MANNENNKVAIAMICDDNYVVPTFVTMQSIIDSKDVGTDYDFNIVCASLTAHHEELFQYFNSEGVTVNIIRQDANRYGNLHTHSFTAPCVATTAALLKFELPNLLTEYDKVLYLDGDIIVRSDLSKLYTTNIGDCLLGAVADTGGIYYKQKYTDMVEVYFNSGVMLLNLEQMRKENTTDTLVQTKQELNDSTLMDQNVFNIVCDGRVHRLSIENNFLGINLRRARRNWNIIDINRLFKTKYTSSEELFESWDIFHFSSKDKPWKNPLVLRAEDWYFYYRQLPDNMRLIPDNLQKLKDANITISFTSWPGRINTIHVVMRSLLRQYYRADRIVLYLAKEQFPGGEESLPESLKEHINSGELIVKWCDEDLKSHKKYYYAMQDYPEDIIITVDDDEYLPRNAVEELVLCWLRCPDTVCARRTNLILYNPEGEVLPYTDWIHGFRSEPYLSSMDLLAVGCNGVLYPPKLLNLDMLLDMDGVKECIHADDLWLKSIELYDNIPVSVATNKIELNHIKNTQEVAMFHNINGALGGNDAQLENISKYFDEKYGTEGFFKKTLSKVVVGKDFSQSVNVVPYLSNEIKRINAKLNKTYEEKSEINAKLQRTYLEKSGINAKLQQTYKEKSEINAKLQLTYKEKSEINARLQQDYIKKPTKAVAAIPRKLFKRK